MSFQDDEIKYQREHKHRKPLWTNEDCAVIRQEVFRRNAKGLKTTTRSLIKWASEAGHLPNGPKLFKRKTMLRILKKSKLKYGKGMRWRVAHTKQSVLLASSWLTYRITNLQATSSGTLLPKLPEVFLDESFLHVNHGSTGYTWYRPGRQLPTKKDPGARLNIIGAGVFFTDHEELKGQTALMNAWRSTATKPKTGDPPYAWGNVDSATFQEWFRELCNRLRDEILPSLPSFNALFLFNHSLNFSDSPSQCIIYLDNAAYHKVNQNKPPGVSSTTEKMKEFLGKFANDMDEIHERIAFEGQPDYPKLKKAELLSIINQIVQNDPEMFKSCDIKKIAQEFGFIVSFLPPYSPEFNPIELVWANIKQQISFQYSNSNKLDEVEKSLKTLLESIQPLTWKKAYQQSARNEDKFIHAPATVIDVEEEDLVDYISE